MSQNPVLPLPLETERLRIREFEETDLAAYHEIAGDADATRYVFWGPNDLAQSEASLTHYVAAQHETSRSFYELAVVMQNSQQLIGAVSLYCGDPSFRADAELGFVFHPQYWGQGFASEASHALVGAAFQHLGLHRIWATCDRRNDASARVLEKLGMRREGIHLACRRVGDRWVDELSYGLLADEFSGAVARTRT